MDSSILTQVVAGCGVFAVMATASLACSPTQCGLPATFGLAVRVVDGRSNTTICDAKVIATDGSYVEQLQALGGGPLCDYVGAEERAGTYDIRVEKTGYQQGDVRGVNVQEGTGSCPTVAAQAVSVALTRL